jgi:hypothetical protein
VDEDTWTVVLADRWDAKGQLWRTHWHYPVVLQDLPATSGLPFGYNDLISGAWYVSNLYNEKPEQYKITPPWPDRVFTPEAMAGEGVR